jgi:DUF4097 and DUF4098 domain-containing protein YvlB
MLVKFLKTHYCKRPFFNSNLKPISLGLVLLWGGVLSQHSALAVEIPWNGNGKVVVSVSEGHWNIRPSIGKTIKFEGPDVDSGFLLEKRDSQIEIRSRDQLNKTDFGKISADANKKKYELWIPAMASLDFHLLEGNLVVSKLVKEGLLHIQKGKIVLNDMSGTWTLHAQKGDIVVHDSQGRVTVDSYGADIDMKNFTGDAEIANFTGDSNLDKLKGFLSLNQGSGATKVTGSSGTMQFEQARGTLKVQQFGGRVEGQSQEGVIVIALAAEADLHLRTQAGRINVTTVPNSGAALNIATQEGELYVPSYLKIARESGTKSLRNRLRGDIGKSSIFIRSQEGSIVIK